MRAVIILVLLCASPALAVDGTVHNATKDKAQAGATVSLFQITENGPQMLASVKSATDGSFAITPPVGGNAPGPKLLQAAYGGVTYNKMIPPGSPTQNLQLDVFESSAKPGAAKVTTHFLVLEPVGGQISVNESFVYSNDSKVTYNDPDHGTLRFYLPAEAGGKVEVNVVAPNSVAVRRAADKTSEANIYKLDVPVKPGESRIDVSYQMPFTTPGKFETKILYKNPNTKLLAPAGVTVAGTGLTSLGQEPRTQGSIYNFDGEDLRVDVQGAGTLRRGDTTAGQQGTQGDDQNTGAQIAELLPQLYDKISPADGFLATVASVKWILLVVIGMLALAFTFVYRRGGPRVAAHDAAANARAAHDHGR